MTNSQRAQGGDRGGVAGCGMQATRLSHGGDPQPITYPILPCSDQQLMQGWQTWFPIKPYYFVRTTPEIPLPLRSMSLSRHVKAI